MQDNFKNARNTLFFLGFSVTSHMSHYIILGLSMSIGNSGRIVIEVEPEFKRNLYSTLAREGLSLKEWFLREAEAYVSSAERGAPEQLADGLSFCAVKETE